MPVEELRTFVLYDIVEDKTRTRISEVCLDFGLVRVQYSAFAGALNRNKREEVAVVVPMRRELKAQIRAATAVTLAEVAVVVPMRRELKELPCQSVAHEQESPS